MTNEVYVMETNLKPRLMRMRQIVEYCSLSKAHIYQRIAVGDFPKGRFISPGIRVWERCDVDQWLNERLGNK